MSQILNRAKESGMVAGKNPTGMAAALCLACISNNEPK